MPHQRPRHHPTGAAGGYSWGIYSLAQAELTVMEPLEDLIAPFIQSVASGRTEIHSEASLQHELGISLRERLPDRKVLFEQNAASLFPSKTPLTKLEISVSIFSQDI